MTLKILYSSIPLFPCSFSPSFLHFLAVTLPYGSRQLDKARVRITKNEAFLGYWTGFRWNVTTNHHWIFVKSKEAGINESLEAFTETFLHSYSSTRQVN